VTRRRVVTTRRADEDVDGALAHYLGEGAADAAFGFVDALEDAKGLLRDHPSIGSPRFAIETGIPELRGLSLQRFPYVVFYTDDPDAVRIHRVLHMSRDIPAELSGP
jgi:toxin ParE1/3/4